MAEKQAFSVVDIVKGLSPNWEAKNTQPYQKILKVCNDTFWRCKDKYFILEGVNIKAKAPYHGIVS